MACEEPAATDAAALWSEAFAGATLAAMRAYDRIIAPLFTPWAHDLLDRLGPPPGSHALDVAAGPGTVAVVLADRLGPDGRVTATDISPAMLEIARCRPTPPGAAPIEWVEAAATPLPVPDATVDVLTCQQGVQFFPDKLAALAEMRRVLRPGGRAGIAVWTRVEDQVFGYLHHAIANVVSAEVAARYLGPFLMAGAEVATYARAAGFEHVELEQVTLPAVLPGGPRDIMGTLPAAGIAADIAALDDRQRAALLAEVTRLTEHLRDGEAVRSSMTASVLVLG